MKQIQKTSKQWYDEIPEDKKIIKLDPDGWEKAYNNIQESDPIEIENTIVQPDSHDVVCRDNPFNVNEAPEDNSHGDLVSLVWLIEKLRRREGGCIMNELIDEAKKHFSGLQYIKKR